jgi:tripeptide aminopeptidase
MEAAERILAEPQRHHGPIWIAFTPDEEVGRGVDKFDLEAFGARIAYTIDGEARGLIEKETFNAHSATFHLRGYNVHPGTAKDKMVNTLYAAAEIIRRLPADMRPETTEGREGYLHPQGIQGVVDQCTIRLLVRDFDLDGSREKIALLERIRDEVGAAYPKTEISLEVKERYLNMGPKIDEQPRIFEIAMEAAQRCGVPPQPHAIRGGTDGARLSYMGVLTPNIFTGGGNYHSVREWVSLQVMEEVVAIVREIAALWVAEVQGDGGRS